MPLRAPSLRRFAAGTLASTVAVFGVLALRVHDGSDPGLQTAASTAVTTTTASDTTTTTSDTTTSDATSTSGDDSSASAVTSTPPASTSAS